MPILPESPRILINSINDLVVIGGPKNPQEYCQLFLQRLNYLTRLLESKSGLQQKSPVIIPQLVGKITGKTTDARHVREFFKAFRRAKLPKDFLEKSAENFINTSDLFRITEQLIKDEVLFNKTELEKKYNQELLMGILMFTTKRDQIVVDSLFKQENKKKRDFLFSVFVKMLVKNGKDGLELLFRFYDFDKIQKEYPLMYSEVMSQAKLADLCFIATTLPQSSPYYQSVQQHLQRKLQVVSQQPEQRQAFKKAMLAEKHQGLERLFDFYRVAKPGIEKRRWQQLFEEILQHTPAEVLCCAKRLICSKDPGYHQYFMRQLTEKMAGLSAEFYSIHLSRTWIDNFINGEKPYSLQQQEILLRCLMVPGVLADQQLSARLKVFLEKTDSALVKTFILQQLKKRIASLRQVLPAANHLTRIVHLQTLTQATQLLEQTAAPSFSLELKQEITQYCATISTTLVGHAKTMTRDQWQIARTLLLSHVSTDAIKLKEQYQAIAAVDTSFIFDAQNKLNFVPGNFDESLDESYEKLYKQLFKAETILLSEHQINVVLYSLQIEEARMERANFQKHYDWYDFFAVVGKLLPLPTSWGFALLKWKRERTSKKNHARLLTLSTRWRYLLLAKDQNQLYYEVLASTIAVNVRKIAAIPLKNNQVQALRNKFIEYLKSMQPSTQDLLNDANKMKQLCAIYTAVQVLVTMDPAANEFPVTEFLDALKLAPNLYEKLQAQLYSIAISNNPINLKQRVKVLCGLAQPQLTLDCNNEWFEVVLSSNQEQFMHLMKQKGITVESFITTYFKDLVNRCESVKQWFPQVWEQYKNIFLTTLAAVRSTLSNDQLLSFIKMIPDLDSKLELLYDLILADEEAHRSIKTQMIDSLIRIMLAEPKRFSNLIETKKLSDIKKNAWLELIFEQEKYCLSGDTKKVDQLVITFYEQCKESTCFGSLSKTTILRLIHGLPQEQAFEVFKAYSSEVNLSVEDSFYLLNELKDYGKADYLLQRICTYPRPEIDYITQLIKVLYKNFQNTSFVNYSRSQTQGYLYNMEQSLLKCYPQFLCSPVAPEQFFLMPTAPASPRPYSRADDSQNQQGLLFPLMLKGQELPVQVFCLEQISLELCKQGFVPSSTL